MGGVGWQFPRNVNDPLIWILCWIHYLAPLPMPRVESFEDDMKRISSGRWYLQAHVKCSMRIFWLGKKKVSIVFAYESLNLVDNEALVISGCPFSQAAFDCTCSVAYRWRFFNLFLLLAQTTISTSFQTDFIRLRLTPVTVILFLMSLCSIASQKMTNWVQIGLEIPKSYSYSIAYS